MATTSMSDTEPARPRVHRSARRDAAHASSPIHVTIPDLASMAWISHISQRGLRLGSGPPASRGPRAGARLRLWGLGPARRPRRLRHCDARVSAL
jgi:hypothetical protein